MSIVSMILSFFWHIMSGETFNLWKAHKQSEADDAKNKTNALSDIAAVDELHTKWTRD